MKLLAVASLVLLVLAAACGGGGGGGTATVTVTSSTPTTVTPTTTVTAVPATVTPATVEARLAALHLTTTTRTAGNLRHGVQVVLRNKADTITIAVYGTTRQAQDAMLRISGTSAVGRLVAEGYHVARYQNVVMIARLIGPIEASLR